MRLSYAISAAGHAVVLIWSMWTLAAKPLPPPTSDALPVDLVNVSDFTKMTAGVENAAQTETPKPLAEKVAEAKPVDDSTGKIDTKEVKAARETTPPPDAGPKETKSADVKPEKKAAEVKPDPIAEALAKQEQKKAEQKKAEARTPIPPKKPPPPAPKFEPNQVRDLLDKKEATRVAAAGPVLNETPSLGLSSGTAAQLSQNEFDAFRRRLEECWSPPVGVDRTTKANVIVRVLFKPDGSVAQAPQVVSGPASALGPAMADSAKRAILRCQPFKMLRPESYEQWKDIEINFDPQQMLRG